MKLKDIHILLIRLFPVTIRSYFWKENYLTAHPSVDWWEGHINFLVLNQYARYLSGRVVDFGCNHGACTILAARNPEISEIIGIDINPKSIALANDLLKLSDEKQENKMKIKFFSSDCTRLPFESDFFDNGYMFHVIEHMSPEIRIKALSEIKRVLRKEGYFLLTLPFMHAYDDFHHIEYFDEKKIRTVIESAGFEVIECYRDQRTDRHAPKGHDCLTVLCRNHKAF